MDFCSVTTDGGMDHNILQQRLHAVGKQREEFQQMEIELHAQVLILEMHDSFDAQIKEHVNANVKLQVFAFPLYLFMALRVPLILDEKWHTYWQCILCC